MALKCLFAAPQKCKKTIHGETKKKVFTDSQASVFLLWMLITAIEANTRSSRKKQERWCEVDKGTGIYQAKYAVDKSFVRSNIQ